MSKPKFTITDLFGNDTKFISYTLNGKTVIRRTSAPSKERIQNDPAYHKVKMNNQEFAAATALSKAIRNQNLKVVFQPFKDTYMAGRLTGVCRKIIQQGSGELGKREACIASNGCILEQFPLNKQRPLSYTFKGTYQLQTTPNRDTVALSTSISKADLTGQPKTATHVQLTLAMATVSKHLFNTKTKTYQPEHPSQNAIGLHLKSQPIAISKTPVPVQLEANLPLTEPLANTTAIVVALGISFGSLEHNTMYDLKSANAMNIIKIL